MAKQNLKSFVISTLRRASFRWKPRTEAMGRARVERGYYLCEMCKQTVHRKEIILDHIHPVVPPSGFTNWDDYINRMFCNSEGFQVICRGCSTSKTMVENEMRKKYKKIEKRLAKRKRKG